MKTDDRFWVWLLITAVLVLVFLAIVWSSAFAEEVELPYSTPTMPIPPTHWPPFYTPQPTPTLHCYEWVNSWLCAGDPTPAPTMDPSETAIPYPSPEPTPGFDNEFYLPIIVHSLPGPGAIIRERFCREHPWWSLRPECTRGD